MLEKGASYMVYTIGDIFNPITAARFYSVVVQSRGTLNLETPVRIWLEAD